MADDGSVLTRKIGPLPGWAWGLIAIGGGYLLLSRFRGSPSQGNSGLSPAASAIPFVPSVTVTGVPSPSQPSPPSSTPGSNLQNVNSTYYPRNPVTGAIYDISQGCKYHITLQQWQGLVQAGANSTDVNPAQLSAIPDCSGSQGYGGGQTGVPAVTAMMGWTTGWGSPSRTVRYPYGGGGAPAITNRTSAMNSFYAPSPGYGGGASKSRGSRTASLFTGRRTGRGAGQAWYPSLNRYAGSGASSATNTTKTSSRSRTPTRKTANRFGLK